MAKGYSIGGDKNPFLLGSYCNKVLQPIEDSFLPLLCDFCQGTEAIIFTPPAFAAYELGEKQILKLRVY